MFDSSPSRFSLMVEVTIVARFIEAVSEVRLGPFHYIVTLIVNCSAKRLRQQSRVGPTQSVCNRIRLSVKILGGLGK